jgi:hypothetical protein
MKMLDRCTVVGRDALAAWGLIMLSHPCLTAFSSSDRVIPKIKSSATTNAVCMSANPDPFRTTFEAPAGEKQDK